MPSSEFELSVPQVEYERARNRLFSILIKDDIPPKQKEKIEEDVEKKLKKAIGGWRTAPKTFESRIRVLFGLDPNWEPISKKTANRKRIPDPNVSPHAVENSGEILDGLSKSEKNFLHNRLSKYKKEFEFNESSDMPMVLQLIYEEIYQRRMIQAKMKNFALGIDKEMTESNKRLASIQRDLGITRKQRQDAQTDIDGSVSVLAEQISKKFRMIAEINAQQLMEEDLYMKKKSESPHQNVIPSMTDLKRISLEDDN
jgi:hypothetical protein